MTPSARLAAVVDILSELEDSSLALLASRETLSDVAEDSQISTTVEGRAPRQRPADQVANLFFRNRRYIGAKDRRAITACLWRVLRHRARLIWWLEQQDMPAIPRTMVLADAALHREELEFGGAHGLASPTAEERRLIANLEKLDIFHHEMPNWVKSEVPQWIIPRLESLWGDETLAELGAMRGEAPLDVRVNLLKSNREEVLSRLKSEGIPASPTVLSPVGVRLKQRVPLVQYETWRKGLIEVQDEGSQLVALLTDAQPSQSVVDYCAGAGGKTLALAAAMKNTGRLIACDVAAWRVDKAKERLRRAGVHNVTRRVITGSQDKWIKRSAKGFDRVLVDVPCSGTGTWRRNPDAKWSMTETDILELVVRQAEVLESAARLVKENGRLIYATCSVLWEENEQQITDFLTRHSDFELLDVSTLWKDLIPEAECPVSGPYLRLSPLRHNTDGFFAAVLLRKPNETEEAS